MKRTIALVTRDATLDDLSLSDYVDMVQDLRTTLSLEDEARRADELASIVREAQGREAQAAVNIVALTFALYDATRERAWDTAVIGADVRGRFSVN